MLICENKVCHAAFSKAKMGAGGTVRLHRADGWTEVCMIATSK
ncbi:protein of unknown function [Paraburkholderia kururiensis]